MSENKILIIDDDPDLVGLVKTLLLKNGFRVLTAFDGSAGLRILNEEGADLVILDLMMPDMDGWKVVRAIRQRMSIPVIILSARDQIPDLVRGLDSGADDFVTKPFVPIELLARVNVKLRRDGYVNAAKTGPPIFSDGVLTIDVEGLMVHVFDVKVELSATELKLLTYLFINRERSCTYAELLESVWGNAYTESYEYVHGYVHRIRSKLKKHGATRPYLLTDRGIGYRFVG